MPELEPKIHLVEHQSLRGNTKSLFHVASKAKY